MLYAIAVAAILMSQLPSTTNCLSPSGSKSSATSQEYTTGLRSDPDRRTIEAVAPRLWLAQEHHVTTAGHSLSFEQCDWLIDLYRDESPKIIVRKASQICISEWMICEMFSRARAGHAGMYILPTDVLRNTFVPRRIDKLLQRVAFYRANYSLARKDSDMKSQKVFWGQDWRFAGANAPDNFYEFPCSTLLFDEYDRCLLKAGGNLQLAYDRLGKAKLEDQRIIIVGNPSRPGYGVDHEYEKSDKKRYLIKCESCNEYQPLNWFVNFVREDEDGWSLLSPGDHNIDAAAVCCKCERAINRLKSGEWVAEHLGRLVSGYHASKLFGDNRPGLVMQLMFDKFIEAQGDPTLLQIFYNNYLGEPFRAEGSAITLDILASCVADYKIPKAATGAFAGADVGKHLHVQIDKIINGKPSLLFAGTVRNYEELAQVSRRFGVVCGVIDALPEQHATPEFIRDNPAWYQCFYSLPDTAKVDIDPDYKTQTLRTNRTASLDATLAWYMMKREAIPRNWQALDNGDYAAQMTAATRVFNEDRGKYEWQEGDKPDHHHHAANYKRIAHEIGGGDLVTVL